MASETPGSQPEHYSPYTSKLAQAIERGQGLDELERQIEGFAQGVHDRLESLGTRKGWQDLMLLLKSESALPLTLRKKISVAQSLARDVGLFIEQNPKATDDDIRQQVDRTLQASGDKAAFTAKTETILDDQASLSLFIQEIQAHPEKAGDILLKLAHKLTSLATHEHLKDYAKESAVLVPFPFNIHLALFVASFHARLMVQSAVNWVLRRPVSAEELKHNVYKNHLSRVLSQLSEGMKDTGSTLIAIPGLSGLSDYILRNTVNGVLKNTADVLEKGDTSKIRDSVTQIIGQSVSLSAMDADTLANNIVGEIDKLAGTGTTKVAKETAVSARYTRISKFMRASNEIIRAVWGYTVNGAPSAEQRREKFMAKEMERQRIEQEKRQRDSQSILFFGNRGGNQSEPMPLLITPLTGTFHRRSSLNKIDVELPNGLHDGAETSHDLEIKYLGKDKTEDPGPENKL